MDKLAEYLKKTIWNKLGTDENKTFIVRVEQEIDNALSKLDKQDLIKMLDTKQCQCNEP